MDEDHFEFIPSILPTVRHFTILFKCEPCSLFKSQHYYCSHIRVFEILNHTLAFIFHDLGERIEKQIDRQNIIKIPVIHLFPLL